MSKQEIKTTVFTCDICQKESITPVEELYRYTTGFSGFGGSAIGIRILAKPFGDYREHVCMSCAKEALMAAINDDDQEAKS